MAAANSPQDRSAVVLLSGGLDSATCLAVARQSAYRCHGLSFDYGQRSVAEIAAAAVQAREQGVAEHRILRLPLGEFGGSSLTDADMSVPDEPTEGIPSTYVPARNTVFLSMPWPGLKSWERPQFSLASTRSTTQVIPIAARNSCKPSSA